MVKFSRRFLEVSAEKVSILMQDREYEKAFQVLDDQLSATIRFIRSSRLLLLHVGTVVFPPSGGRPHHRIIDVDRMSVYRILMSRRSPNNDGGDHALILSLFLDPSSRVETGDGARSLVLRDSIGDSLVSLHADTETIAQVCELLETIRRSDEDTRELGVELANLLFSSKFCRFRLQELSGVYNGTSTLCALCEGEEYIERLRELFHIMRFRDSNNDSPESVLAEYGRKLTLVKSLREGFVSTPEQDRRTIEDSLPDGFSWKEASLMLSWMEKNRELTVKRDGRKRRFRYGKVERVVTKSAPPLIKEAPVLQPHLLDLSTIDFEQVETCPVPELRFSSLYDMEEAEKEKGIAGFAVKYCARFGARKWLFGFSSRLPNESRRTRVAICTEEGSKRLDVELPYAPANRGVFGRTNRSSVLVVSRELDVHVLDSDSGEEEFAISIANNPLIESRKGGSERNDDFIGEYRVDVSPLRRSAAIADPESLMVCSLSGSILAFVTFGMRDRWTWEDGESFGEYLQSVYLDDNCESVYVETSESRMVELAYDGTLKGAWSWPEK